MDLLSNQQLDNSATVANCRMNRERNLYGTNGYDTELRLDPISYLREVGSDEPVRWLDLCCGSATALAEADKIIAKAGFPITIVGIDLVDMFTTSGTEQLKLINASLNEWMPAEPFDLITCVHGLHYLGDKLGLIVKFSSWLTANGRFVANFDPNNLKLAGRKTSRTAIEWMRREGIQFSASHKLLECQGRKKLQIPFEYLGADDQAGPNYTGQPAVNSHYQTLKQV